MRKSCQKCHLQPKTPDFPILLINLLGFLLFFGCSCEFPMGAPNLPTIVDYGPCPDCIPLLPPDLDVSGSHYVCGSFFGKVYQGGEKNMYSGSFAANGYTIQVLLWFCFGTDECYITIGCNSPGDPSDSVLAPGINSSLPFSYTLPKGSTITVGPLDRSQWNYEGGFYPDPDALLETLHENDDTISIRTANKKDATNFAIQVDKGQIP